MKRFFYDETDRGECRGQIIIGTDRDIRSLYKNMKEHDFSPIFVGEPKFKACSIYGIDLDESGQYVVLNSDTLVRLFLDGFLKEDKKRSRED